MGPLATNPFRYGDLALDEAFADREEELRELVADLRSGQNVVLSAPRRYGKTSLVWRALQELTREGMLVAQVDLMQTPTKERLAERLARSIHDDMATVLFRAKERLGVFRGLRVTPVVTVDPDDGSVGFSFNAGHRRADIDATLERLLELPAQLAADRGRRAVVVFDEFQEVTEIDPNLPALMRSIFQTQPDVAHVYLGSRRDLLERIFNDENEPFWRSAKQIALGPIPREPFAAHIHAQLARTGRAADDAVVDVILDTTQGHPYATQELCSFLWQEIAAGATATPADLDQAMARLLRSEDAHFTRIWERAPRGQRLLLHALAQGPGRPLATEFRRRFGLGAASSVQKALAALVRDELAQRDADGRYRIAEPFLAEWIRRRGR
jgi:uncharacterized protein